MDRMPQWRRQWHPTPVHLPGKIPRMEEPGRLQSMGSLRVGVAEGQTRLSDFTFTFHFHALKKGMATHVSVLAWRIPGTVEPSGLPSLGSHRVGHDWSDLAAAAAAVLDPVVQPIVIYLFFLLSHIFASSTPLTSNYLSLLFGTWRPRRWKLFLQSRMLCPVSESPKLRE